MSLARFIQEAERFARNAAPLAVAGRDLYSAGSELSRALRGPPAQQFEDSHGGRAADLESMVDVPNAGSGLIALGELDAVLYWADKGGGMERHAHDFGEADGQGRKVTALPVLAFCADGSGLVIVRSDTPRGISRYTVTKHGIEG